MYRLIQSLGAWVSFARDILAMLAIWCLGFAQAGQAGTNKARSAAMLSSKAAASMEAAFRRQFLALETLEVMKEPGARVRRVRHNALRMAACRRSGLHVHS